METITTLKLLCPYCNTVWTAKMEQEFCQSAEGCDSCGDGEEFTYKIIIVCDNCKKTVYVKEGVKKS